MFVLKTLFIINNIRVWCFDVSMFSNYKLKLSALKASQKAGKQKGRLGYTALYGHPFLWSWVIAKIHIFDPLPLGTWSSSHVNPKQNELLNLITSASNRKDWYWDKRSKLLTQVKLNLSRNLYFRKVGIQILIPGVETDGLSRTNASCVWLKNSLSCDGFAFLECQWNGFALLFPRAFEQLSPQGELLL